MGYTYIEHHGVTTPATSAVFCSEEWEVQLAKLPGATGESRACCARDRLLGSDLPATQLRWCISQVG